MNSGFPERAVHQWKLKQHNPFKDGETAHAHEAELKGLFETQFVSAGNEFFYGDWKAISDAFHIYCISKMHKIIAAPRKSKSVR